MSQLETPTDENVLFTWLLALVCGLRWEVRDDDQLWVWFPIESLRLQACGFTDTLAVANIPL